MDNFQNYHRCDKYQRNVLYSEISDIGYNQPVYTVTINNDVVIEGYIYDGEIVPLVKDKEIIIQPKKEITIYLNSVCIFGGVDVK